MNLLAREPERRRTFLALTAAASAASSFALAPAWAHAAEPIVMKIGTATLNDLQHEFMRRYRAAGSPGWLRCEVRVWPGACAMVGPSGARAVQ